MGTLDDAMASVAESLIDTFVTNKATFRREGDSETFSGGETTSADLDWSIKVGVPEPFTNREIDGTQIKTGDLKVMVARKHVEAATPTSPAFGGIDPKTDRVIFSGETKEYRIVRMDPVMSGDQAAAWNLQLRA